MKEKLKELEKNMLIELSSWGGLGPFAGISKVIITYDKKIYYYKKYFHLPEQIMKQNDLKPETLSEGNLLSNDQYNIIVNFIEKEIVNKIFEPVMLFDAGYDVYVNYPDCQSRIINSISGTDDKCIYDNAYKLLREILE